MLRDTTERGRSVEGSLMQYNRFVYPAFKQHIEPTMQYADLVVPNGTLVTATDGGRADGPSALDVLSP